MERAEGFRVGLSALSALSALRRHGVTASACPGFIMSKSLGPASQLGGTRPPGGPTGPEGPLGAGQLAAWGWQLSAERGREISFVLNWLGCPSAALKARITSASLSLRVLRGTEYVPMAPRTSSSGHLNGPGMLGQEHVQSSIQHSSHTDNLQPCSGGFALLCFALLCFALLCLALPCPTAT
jgi:hypothetical protein